MIRPFPEFDEFRALLDALCEESITPEQVRRLEELILTRPEAEAYYVQYMSLFADLAGRFGVMPARAERSLRDRVGAGGQGAKGPEPSGRRFRLPAPRRLLVAASGLAAGLLLALLLWPRPPGTVTSPAKAAEAEDNTVAVLLQAPGAEWQDTGLPTRTGAPLPPGWLSLKAGYAHLEFYSGATVILEGPAEFQLISRTEAYCARGKLRATVPAQAQGFTIGSPQLDLVDRGTEFGLEVAAGGKTEVHVFQGKVDLYDAGTDREAKPRQEVTTGQGVRLEGPGVRVIAPNPAAFRTARELAEQALEETRRRQRAWQGASEALRKDPDLLVYYTFQAEKPWSRTLTDQAAGGRRPAHDGAVVGCAWAAGRWGGKQGLEFKQVSDRVRLHVPGQLDALTLAAWVRVDALPNRFNSLFMTDSWDDSEPHWHVSDDGKLELGVQGPSRKNGVHYYSPVVFTPERLGQWTHLAVTYDRAAGQVTHYLDGKPISQEALQLDVALTIGNAEIGNWNVTTRRHHHPIRYFTGCVDEFLLFSRALGDQDVERLYTEGRPPAP
jgi:hypothetical protein